MSIFGLHPSPLHESVGQVTLHIRLFQGRASTVLSLVGKYLYVRNREESLTD